MKYPTGMIVAGWFDPNLRFWRQCRPDLGLHLDLDDRKLFATAAPLSLIKRGETEGYDAYAVFSDKKTWKAAYSLMRRTARVRLCGAVVILALPYGLEVEIGDQFMVLRPNPRSPGHLSLVRGFSWPDA